MNRGAAAGICAVLGVACSGAETGVGDAVQRMGACVSCTIEIGDRYASLKDDPRGNFGTEYVEHAGAIWVVGGALDESVISYPLDGGPSRVDDRTGSGPGEFSDQVSGAALHPSGDSLVISNLGRIEYFVADGPRLRYVRGFNTAVPVRGELVVLDDGSIVSSNSRPAGPKQAQPFTLHHVSPAGELLRSFLRTEPEFASGFVSLARSANGDKLWALMRLPDGFRIELWDPGARAFERSFTLRPDWWYTLPATPEEIEREGLAGRINRMKPNSNSVDVFDTGSVLWVVLSHADPGFMERDRRYIQPSVSRDAVLLALDPLDGRVLAGTVFDEGSSGFTNQGHLLLQEDQESGIPRIYLKEISLEGRAESHAGG